MFQTTNQYQYSWYHWCWQNLNHFNFKGWIPRTLRLVEPACANPWLALECEGDWKCFLKSVTIGDCQQIPNIGFQMCSTSRSESLKTWMWIRVNIKYKKGQKIRETSLTLPSQPFALRFLGCRKSPTHHQAKDRRMAQVPATKVISLQPQWLNPYICIHCSS